MGQQSISDWALKLERASANGDIGKCRSETENYCVQMESFRAALLRTTLMDDSGDDSGNQTAKDKIDAGSLIEELKSIGEACEICDADTVDAFLDKLRQVTFREDIDARITGLSELADSFNFVEINDRCGKIIAEISQDLPRQIHR
jgi:hypothetical protein